MIGQCSKHCYQGDPREESIPPELDIQIPLKYGSLTGCRVRLLWVFFRRSRTNSLSMNTSLMHSLIEKHFKSDIKII